MGSLAVPAGVLPQTCVRPAVYRPRNPRASFLYQLFETHFEALKRQWEERFERRFGFWQAYWDSAVFSHLDCGRFESGFARVVCPACRHEFLVAFSCKGRGLCPSCGAKRAVLFSSLLQERILVDAPHVGHLFHVERRS
jgi:hypothetical protein